MEVSIKLERIDLSDHWLKNWTESEDLDLKPRIIKDEPDHELVDLGKRLQPVVLLHDIMKRKKKGTIHGRAKRALQSVVNRATEVSKNPSARCTFACPGCPNRKVFKAWTELKRHFAVSGHGSSQNNVENIGTLAKDVAVYECTICCQRVLSDPQFLNVHMKNKHRMTLAEYKTKKGIRVCKGTAYFRAMQKLCDGAPEHDEPVPKCLFKCPDCVQSSESFRSMRNHFSTAGHGTRNRLDNIVRSISNVFSYRCRICSQRVLCDPHFIGCHTQEWHGIGLKKYKERLDLRHLGRDSRWIRQREILRDVCLGATSVTEEPAAKCVFKCKLCNTEWKSWNSLNSHIALQNHGDRGSILAMKELVSKVFAFVCRMCNEKTLCDLFFIGRHLYQAHKTNAKEYKKRYNMVEEKRPSTNKKILLPEVLKEVLAESPESSQPVSKCNFKCRVCDFECRRWVIMKAHFKDSSHDDPYDLESIKRNAKRIVKYKCRYCQSMLVSDSVFIADHVRNKHKMSMTEYGKRYYSTRIKTTNEKMAILKKGVLSAKVVGNLCKFACKKCRREFSTLPQLNNHLKQLKHGKTDHSGGNEYLTKTVTHACLICKKLLLCDLVYISDHVQKRHGFKSLDEYCSRTGATLQKSPMEKLIESADVSAKPGNFCKFKCASCQTLGRSWKVFIKHKCSTIKKKFRLEDGHEYLDIVRSFICPICGKRMLCDAFVIKGHIGPRHNLNLADLENEESGRKWVEERNEYCEAEYEEFVKDIPTFDAQKRPVLKQGVIPHDKVTINTGNICKYRCPTCQKEIRSWRMLAAHMRKTHHQKEFKYDPEFVSVARYHSCLKCKISILCDNLYVFAHLRQVHGINHHEYKELVKENGGQVLTNVKERRELAACRP